MIKKFKAISLDNYIAFLFTSSVCLQRIVYLFSDILWAIASILLIYKIYSLNKNGELKNSIKHKDIIIALGLCMLTMLPSVSMSPKVIYSIRELLTLFVYRTMPILGAVVVFRNINVSKKMLLAVGVMFSLDCLTAVYQVAFGHIGNGYGFSQHYLHLAGLECLLLPMLLVGVLEDSFSKKEKLALGVMLFCAVLGLGAGFSRGACAIVAFLCIVVFIVYGIKKPKLFVIMAIIIAVLGAGILSQPKVVTRLQSITNTSTNGSNIARFWMWRSCIAIAKDYPVSGCGLGNYQATYEESYNLKGLPFEHAHNNYFQMLAEAGVVGALGFIVFNLYLCFSNMWAWFITRSPYRMMLGLGSIGYMIFGFFEYILGHADIAMIWWFVYACLLTLDDEYNASREGTING